MDMRNTIELVVKKDDKECKLVCDNNAPLGFIFDSLSEMLGYVGQKLQESLKQKTDLPVEESKMQELPKEE
jgi:hypothetical protein